MERHGIVEDIRGGSGEDPQRSKSFGTQVSELKRKRINRKTNCRSSWA